MRPSTVTVWLWMLIASFYGWVITHINAAAACVHSNRAGSQRYEEELSEAQVRELILGYRALGLHRAPAS